MTNKEILAELKKCYEYLYDIRENGCIDHCNGQMEKHLIDKLEVANDFYCGVMVSIAGFMSSPFFSLYGATKAALKVFIESVNVELEKAGSPNRIPCA